MPTREDLEKQLAAFEVELEGAKAHIYRLDGAIQLLKNLLAQDKPEPVDTEMVESSDG